jgi:hypothetical protein
MYLGQWFIAHYNSTPIVSVRQTDRYYYHGLLPYTILYISLDGIISQTGLATVYLYMYVATVTVQAMGWREG